VTVQVGYVLGVNSMWHDAAACLVGPDGDVIAAVEEERFTRNKDERRFPTSAIRYCLRTAGITIDDVTHLGLPRQARLYAREKLKWNLFAERGGPAVWKKDIRVLSYMRRPPRLLRAAFPGARSYPRTVFVRHHTGHAASAFYVSPFEQAAYFTADGMGEWECTTWGTGSGTRLRQLGGIDFPHSLGQVYWSVAHYLGLGGVEKAGKLMALAAYGRPTLADRFTNILFGTDDGGYRINYDLFDFRIRQRVSPRFADAIGFGPRSPDGPLEQVHYDLAATVQDAVERIVLGMLRRLHETTGMRSLVLAGGVALNSVLNGKVLAETPFEEVFIQPAADDAGLALGSACYIVHQLGGRPRRAPMTSAALGPDIEPQEVEEALRREGGSLSWERHEDIAGVVAGLLADGAIVGWCRGRMEYGPRALGQRSILADPTRATMRDALNEVKAREWYRPVAPAVLEEHAAEWFEGIERSPFMLLVGRVRADRADTIPAALHVDGTARVQTVNREASPEFHRLIAEFGRRTGVPILLNTSLNGRGEPICCTASDAVRMFLDTKIDALALDQYLVRRGPAIPAAQP
jgi:carbamoyltransferase